MYLINKSKKNGSESVEVLEILENCILALYYIRLSITISGCLFEIYNMHSYFYVLLKKITVLLLSQ